MVSGVASFPIIGNKLAELIARQVFAQTAVLNAFSNAALDKVAVWVDTGDTAGAPGRIIGTFAAPVPAIRGIGPFPGHRVIPLSGPLASPGPIVIIRHPGPLSCRGTPERMQHRRGRRIRCRFPEAVDDEARAREGFSSVVTEEHWVMNSGWLVMVV